MFSGTVPMCDEEGESIKHSPQHYEGNDDNQIAESICDDLQFGSLVRRGYGTDDARRASAIVQEQPPERLWFVAQRMLFDADARHRLSGGEKLLRLDPQRAIPYVLPLLKDSEQVVRMHICGVLHDFGDARATEALVGMLREETDGTTRYLITYTLEAIGDVRALSLLEWVSACDKSEDWQGRPVAWMANAAIRAIKHREGIPDNVDYE